MFNKRKISKFIFLTFFLIPSNMAFADSVISYNNKQEVITDLVENIVVVTKDGVKTLQNLQLENLHKLGLNYSQDSLNLVRGTYKIQDLMSNFNYDLEKVTLYSDDNFSIIYLDKNAEVEFLQKTDNWFKISYNSKIYYINEEEIKSKDLIVIAQQGLNLRANPSTDSQILEVLDFNSSLELIESLQGWIKVKTIKGNIGYVSSEFVKQKESFKNEVFTKDATQIIEYAKTFLGSPYLYGGVDPATGSDCSGFTMAIFNHFGIQLNRTSKDQYSNGVYVEKENIQPGDLVFFSQNGTSDAISHIGIYIGQNEYIHSASEEHGVIISSMLNPFSQKYYFGARRVLT